MKLLEIDDLQARAILNMQLRQLAALERQKIIDEAAALEAEIKGYKKIIKDESLQRKIVTEELAEITEKYGDDRRTQIVAADGDVSVEDLIPEEGMVVTLTAGGYIKRTRSTSYRVQHRGGKGVKGTSLRADDVVQNFIVSTTHHWLMFFTNKGRVYRAKVHEIQEGSREAKGQHVANLLALQPDERVVEVIDLKDYQQAPYLVIATKDGLVKKTELELYDTSRTGGIIAIKLRKGDEVVNAMLVEKANRLLLVSKKGMSICFAADNESLRPMGRDTSGVTGMKFRKGDELLSARVIGKKGFVFVVTEGGYAKRTSVDQYRVQGRGGLGIKVAKLDEKRGDLVGSEIVDESDEVLVVLASGKVMRTPASEVPAKGRDTLGVVFARFEEGDAVLSLAKNSERNLETSEGA
jgi:DNA gyrase subunit A